MTALRRTFDFIRAESVTPQHRVVVNLDTAFRNFFTGKASFPKFKKKGLGDSFSHLGREIAVERLNKKYARVRLPKVGWIKFRHTRHIEGCIISATITHGSLGWQISFSSRIDREIADVGGVVGIDRGVAVPLALSDGQTFALPLAIGRLDRLQKKGQRIASRRKRGSRRHAKAQERVRKLAGRKARIRKDWAHKATTAIAGQYGTVVVERLRTANMTKSGNGKRGLNRVILNVGWHQIESMLAYKAFKLAKVNPAHTSQACASCGTVDRENRKSQAVFLCVHCGHRDNADRNAAINIRNRGSTAVLDVEGSGYAPVEASTSLVETVPILGHGEAEQTAQQPSRRA